MMKLARILATHSDLPVDRLLGQASVDLLQLDLAHSSSEPETDLLSPNIPAVPELWKLIHRSMYLRPEIRLITDLAGSHIVSFMEWLGGFLDEHGSGDMPISAVRGSNVLAEIDELFPKQSVLRNKKVVSAQAEIGADSLALALNEGTRIVVAGAYDVAAPYLALAISERLCNRNEKEKLAALAAASQFEGICAELDAEGIVKLEPLAATQLRRVRELGVVKYADLTCDYSDIQLEPAHEQALRITNAMALPNDGQWNVRIVESGGFQALVIIELDSQAARQIRDYCSKFPETDCEMRTYTAAESVRSTSSEVLSLRYQSDKSEDCQSFAEALQLWVKRQIGKKAAFLYAVREVTQQSITRIPADRVVLSVDTRPAREWM